MQIRSITNHWSTELKGCFLFDYVLSLSLSLYFSFCYLLLVRYIWFSQTLIIHISFYNGHKLTELSTENYYNIRWRGESHLGLLLASLKYTRICLKMLKVSWFMLSRCYSVLLVALCGSCYNLKKLQTAQHHPAYLHCMEATNAWAFEEDRYGSTKSWI